jgi:hypothetical protein
VLVAHAIVHDGRSSGENRCHTGFYQWARLSASVTVTLQLTFSAST